VTVVMPFAGGQDDAADAQSALRALRLAPGDELILADNSGVAEAAEGVILVRATGERSPARARNAGAERAANDWILFLDADVRAPADLLDRFFAVPIADEVGALTGSVSAAPGGRLAERYGASRDFLRQDAHLAHPFMPRAAAANLLVRRVAFERVGGFFEGVAAAEDTDFSWRLQRAGWRLEGRPDADVEHRYRASLRALRRQWRGYAAGRAWLARRYDGFQPEPALRRGARRALSRAGRHRRTAGELAWGPAREAPAASRVQRASFAAIDALLGVEELAGLALSNRPARSPAQEPVRVVLVAERFPSPGDPLVALATQLAGVRVEAASRPPVVDRDAARRLRIDYREDDGRVIRAVSLARLALRHPVRCGRDRLGRSPGEPDLAALAPAVARLARERDARLHALGPRTTAVARIARLAGRPLQD